MLAIAVGSLLLAGGAMVSAQGRRDADVVASAQAVAAGEHVEIYRHGVAVVPAFLDAAEEAYRRLHTGRPLDAATLGAKVRIHPKDPKGIVLLLFTWRYHSHTLREGLADYLALQVHPGAGVGPNATGYDRRMKIPPEVVDCLGTTKAPPAWLMSDGDRRRAYYFASYRFVKSLIDQAGMDTFMRLYDAPSTEQALVTLYGMGREDLVRRAGM